MSWATIPPTVRELAERVLTQKQLEAVKLWDPDHVGYRTVAVQLAISPSSARDRIQRALAKIGQEAERVGLDLR